MTNLVPVAALEAHVAVLGKTGAGKSNLTKTVVEKLIASGERVCIIDPKDDWWGLRLERDGKKPSKIKPIIFGGNHADLPLGEQHGAVIAEAVASSSDSVILVTRLMTAGQRTRFFTAFAEALLRVNNGPLHLIIDEAHIFAPEAGKMDIDGAKMLGAANNLVNLGRGYGLRIWLLSQRPQKLSKDALTQAETLIAMRLIHNLDVKAVRLWIGEWATGDVGEEIVKSLPSLPNGDAWVWSPQVNYLKRVHAPLASTYDSGKPPSRDEVAPTLVSIDTSLLGDKMDTIRQEAQANDPKRLKAEIERLKKLASEPQTIVTQVQGHTDEEMAAEHRRGHAEGYEQGVAQGQALAMSTAADQLAELVSQFTAEADRRRDQTADFAKRQSTTPPKLHTPAKQPQNVANGAAKISPSDVRMLNENVITSIGAERKPLAALVAIYPGGLTEAQWAQISGFKRTGGTWRTYKSRLGTRDLIQEVGDLWYATPQGVDAIGADIPEMPEPGPELIKFWCDKLGAESKFLKVLADVYPEKLTSDELASRFDMVSSGGTFRTYLSRLRSNGLIEDDRVSLRVAPALMERA